MKGFDQTVLCHGDDGGIGQSGSSSVITSGQLVDAEHHECPRTGHTCGEVHLKEYDECRACAESLVQKPRRRDMPA